MSLVLREDHGRVAVLILNNPPANGYSYAMFRELDAHILDVRMDPQIDVIVLRGAGEKFFSAGADIHYLRTLNPEQKYAFCLHANETLLRLEHTSKLVIAALNGHCVGGGLEIALACDLRIGRASGEKPNLVGLPEVNLGVLPGTGGTQRFTRILGRSRALQWMVEGRNVSVEAALDAGLLHSLLPAENWWASVLAYAESFCRPHRSASAVGLIKRAVGSGADLPLESGLALERELQQRLFTGADAAEGLSAFVEKRRPHFTGAPGVAPVPEVSPEDRILAYPEDVRRRPGSEAPPPRPHSAPPPGSAPDAREADPFDTLKPRSTLHAEARFNLGRTRLKDEILNLLPRDIVEKHLLIPVRKEGAVLTVAIAKPTDAARLAVEEETGMEVQFVRADEMEIAAAIGEHYRA